MTFRLTLVFLFLHLITQAQPSALYNRRIAFAPDANSDYAEARADLKASLEAATGVSFRMDSGAQGDGILLQRYDPAILPAPFARQLEQASIESFALVGNRRQLRIIARHPAGWVRGIYTYLDQLGFRWYLPGSEWARIPRLNSIIFTASRVIQPAFSPRNYSGTGGLVPGRQLDPQEVLISSWSDYKRRNRLGGAFALSGHYGETFNIAHRAELQAHPEYLALVNGKRQWSETAKWCISNPALRQLFIADRLAELRRRLATAPASEPIVVAVDPADGEGDCTCDACRKMGTASERIFFLANETARQLRSVSPRASANILAYNTHAAPPSFALSPALIVQVVPYAFQQVLSPEKLLDAWRQRQASLMVFDYYGIPDWHFDLPPGGPWNWRAYAGRIRSWNDRGIRGFTLETSYSAGNNGWGQYLIARLGWDPAADPEQEFTTFLQLFGKGAPFMRNYFEKIEAFQGAADLPFVLQQLAQAARSEADPVVRQRIRLYKAYVHFLVLHYRLQSAGTDAAWEALMQYVLQLYPRSVVHSGYLSQMLIARLPGGHPFRAKWSLYTPIGPAVTALRPISDEAIEALFAADLNDLPALEGFPYLPSAKQPQYQLRPAAANKASEEILLLDMPETLVKAGADGMVRLNIKVNEASQNNDRQQVTLRLTDTATGKEAGAVKMEIDRQMRPVNWKVVAGRTYRLAVDHSNWFRISVPAGQWLAFRTIPMYAVMPKLWFFNPGREQFLYFSNGSAEQPVFRNGKGQVLPIEKVNDLKLYRVPVGGETRLSIEGVEYKKLSFFGGLLFFPSGDMAFSQ